MGDVERNITRRAGIVGAATGASRVLGLLRDSVIAACFPAEVTDAFWVAFTIPNSFRRLTAEGAFSTAVTSVFSKLRVQGDEAEARRFVAATSGFAILVLGVLTVAGMLGAAGLTYAAGSGFAAEPGKFELAASLTRWMFPYVFFISLTALAMGLLNSAGRFFAPSFAPVLLNVATIATALTLGGTMMRLGLHPVYSLAIGTLAGGVLQLLFQFPDLKALRLLVRPTFELSHPGLRQVLRLTGPMIVGAVAYQAGLFISASLASTLGRGAVTYIQFSSRLMELPLAVLVMAISTAALPSLAALKAEGRIEDLKATFRHALSLTLFVGAPAMVALIVLAEPVITVLFQRGHFGHADVIGTASALQWMAAGICSVAIIRQTVPVFYALEETRWPVLMTLANIVAYVAAAVPLMGPFGHRGLCMALSLAATAQGLGLVLLLRRRIGPLGLGPVLSSFSRMLLAAAFMGGVAYGVSLLGRWSDGGNSSRNIAVLALAVGLGIVSYFAAALALRIREARELGRAAQRRLLRRRTG